MKFKVFGLTTFILMSFLSSCGQVDFSRPKLIKTKDDSKIYIGSYLQVESEEDTKADNILYLDFYDKGEEIASDNKSSYDYKIVLMYEDLIQFNNISEDNNLKFYDLTNEINTVLKNRYENITEYFNDGNKLDVFFQYGEGNNFYTSRISLKESGLYFFGTIEINGTTPSYSHSLIYSESVEWIN